MEYDLRRCAVLHLLPAVKRVGERGSVAPVKSLCSVVLLLGIVIGKDLALAVLLG